MAANPGIAPVQLKRHLASVATTEACLIPQKLRRAMVAPNASH